MCGPLEIRLNAFLVVIHFIFKLVMTLRMSTFAYFSLLMGGPAMVLGQVFVGSNNSEVEVPLTLPSPDGTLSSICK